MWMHFVTFCNLETSGGHNQHECDAEISAYVHPAYMCPNPSTHRQLGIFMEETLPVNPFINVDRLNVFKTLSLGLTIDPTSDGKVVEKNAMQHAPAVTPAPRMSRAYKGPLAAHGQHSPLYVDTRFSKESPLSSPRSMASSFVSREEQSPRGLYEQSSHHEHHKSIHADEERKWAQRSYGFMAPNPAYNDDFPPFSPDTRYREALHHKAATTSGSWLRSTSEQAIPFMSHRPTQSTLQINTFEREMAQARGFTRGLGAASHFEDMGLLLTSNAFPHLNIFEREMAQVREAERECVSPEATHPAYPEEESLLSSNFFEEKSLLDARLADTMVLPGRSKRFSFSSVADTASDESDISAYRSDVPAGELLFQDGFSSPLRGGLSHPPFTPPFTPFGMDLASPTTVCDISRGSPMNSIRSLHPLKKMLFSDDAAFDEMLDRDPLTEKVTHWAAQGSLSQQDSRTPPSNVWATLGPKSRSASLVDDAYPFFGMNFDESEVTAALRPLNS